MPDSIFSYNLTRKYPYPWFTWLVLIAGIAATAIFTVINLAANGYESSVLYLTNPNATEHPLHPKWFQKAPWSWASKVGSSCQDETLTIGSSFYTSNLGFSYKIVGVGTDESATAVSFSYHNDALRDCSILDIQISPENGTSSVGGAGGLVTVTINCTLYAGFTLVTLSLITTFALNQEGVYSVQINGPIDQVDKPTFLSLENNVQTSSLLWGRALIATYCWLIYDACPEHADFLDGAVCGDWIQNLLAYYEFVSSELAWNLIFSDEFDATAPGFSSFRVYDIETRIPLSSWSSMFGKDMLSQNLTYCNGTDSYGMMNCAVATSLQSPHALQALLMDGLTKSIYFAILTDLGQGAPFNTLASEKQVMKFANETVMLIESRKTYDEIAEELGMVPPWPLWLSNLRFHDVTISEFYKSAQADFKETPGIQGLPQVIPATIATKYLCQVPKLKSVGSMLVSVIVADLVFLQALWVTVSFIMTFFLERRHPSANYCAGCAKDHASEHGEAVEMKPGLAATGNYTQVSDPDEGAVWPVLGSASTSIRSGAVSARRGSLNSVRRRNDANVQSLLASP